MNTLVVPGLVQDEQDILNELLGSLRVVQPVNMKRARYHDAKQLTQHLGIAIPPQLTSVEAVIGWPEKAVAALERRTDLDGFVVPGATAAEFGLDRIWADNHLGTEAPQAHTSAYKFGPAFLAVMAGDTASGEPEVLIRVLSAGTSTVLWDANRRRASAALTLVAAEAGDPTEFILYLADQVVTGRREVGSWVLDRSPHSLGRCPVAVLPFRPSPESPLGRSRISRAVMSITDRAVRSLLRMEISAEFYSSPQRYVLGADESAFLGPDGTAKTGWEITLGKVLALGLNEDDKNPQVGQFPQLTMQPHMDMVRSDAALFAGETDIPVSSLGIIHDNPSSDAAMHTAFLDLNKTAERAHDTFGAGWVDAMQMAVMVRDGLSEVPEPLRLLRAKFRDPATPTKAAAAQAVVAQITAGVLPPESEVTLEQLGYDDVTIQRIVADRRRAAGPSRLAEVLATAQGAPSAPSAAGLDKEAADAMRAKFEALGVAVRAGVDPDSAAAQLGLAGLKFTGAVPVSLRLPEQDAKALEDATGSGV